MKKWVHCNTKTWPSPDTWDIWYDDSYQFEELWQDYLCEPEEKVNEEFNLFVEPNVQGPLGDVFIYDNDTDDELAVVPIHDWEQAEVDIASNSSSAEEYERGYRDYIKDLIGA